MIRLRELRKDKKITMKDLGQVFGLAESTISQYENGKRQPDYEVLVQFAEYFNVSVDYLLGRSEIKESASPEGEDLSVYGISPITVQRLPFLGEIACGEPTYADEDRESYVEVGTNINADFCLRAKGDSMINARIQDGDIIFIKQQPTVDNGEIAAVIINDEATLKRVYYYPEQQQLTLLAENPSFAPINYNGSDLEQIRILGKAVAFQSDVR